MKRTMTWAALSLMVLALGVGRAAADSAKYTLQFDGAWSTQMHPLEYPGNAHFSGLIGATHNGEYRLFEPAGIATPGLKALSERGRHSPMDDEIREGIRAGAAGTLIETSALWNLPKSVSVSFEITEKHSMVSVAAMIAPSPDWFAGIANVALLENGQWVERKEVTVYAWDAGTDSGLTYTAPDQETLPREKVRLNDSPHFMAGGKRIPVGTVTFIKQ